MLQDFVLISVNFKKLFQPFYREFVFDYCSHFVDNGFALGFGDSDVGANFY